MKAHLPYRLLVEIGRGANESRFQLLALHFGLMPPPPRDTQGSALAGQGTSAPRVTLGRWEGHSSDARLDRALGKQARTTRLQPSSELNQAAGSREAGRPRPYHEQGVQGQGGVVLRHPLIPACVASVPATFLTVWP